MKGIAGWWITALKVEKRRARMSQPKLPNCPFLLLPLLHWQIQTPQLGSSLPLHLSYHPGPCRSPFWSLPLEVDLLNTAKGSGGKRGLCPSGNLILGHLDAPVLLIFLRINWRSRLPLPWPGIFSMGARLWICRIQIVFSIAYNAYSVASGGTTRGRGPSISRSSRLVPTFPSEATS